MYHEKKEYPLGNKEQEVREDQRDSLGQSSDNKSVKNMPPGHTPQAGLLRSKLSLSLKEVRFCHQEFTAGIPVSNIKYNQTLFNFFMISSFMD